MVDLQKKVRETRAHLGVAFDGDADRCFFVDETGRIIGCDIITALIARQILEREKGATILYDLRSSWIVPEEIKAGGGIPYRERVGHVYMKATLREKKALFGGELSGHYYFKNNYYSDSGMIAFLMVLEILSTKRVPFAGGQKLLFDSKGQPWVVYGGSIYQVIDTALQRLAGLVVLAATAGDSGEIWLVAQSSGPPTLWKSDSHQ